MAGDNLGDIHIQQRMDIMDYVKMWLVIKLKNDYETRKYPKMNVAATQKSN